MMKKGILLFLFLILLFGLSAKANYARDSIYHSLQKKKFTLQCHIDPMFMSHNHDDTYNGYGVFVNYESPLWPLLLRDYLDRNYKFNKHTFIKFKYVDNNIWIGMPNQLSIQKDTLFLCYHHLLSKYTSEIWRLMRNEIFALIDYGILHQEEIKKLQRIQDKSEHGHEHQKSIPETKMIEIIEDKKTTERIADFFQQTPIYPHINYVLNRDHNLETDSLLSSYFQNDSIHLVNKRTGKVIFKSKEISNLLKISHDNYLFKSAFNVGPIYNYNAKMDKLFILTDPGYQNNDIYAYHGENNIFGIIGWDRDDRQEIGIYSIDKFTYNSTRMEYIFLHENQAPSYYRNVYYEEFLKYYPPPPKYYSYLFAYIGILVLLAFTLWFIKLNLPLKG